MTEVYPVEFDKLSFDRYGIRIAHVIARKWRVSTIGKYRERPNGTCETVGCDRLAETFVFKAYGCTDEYPEGDLDGIESAAVCYTHNDEAIIRATHTKVVKAIVALVESGIDSEETISAAIDDQGMPFKTFSGNAHQRRVKRRAWLREQA